MKKTFTNTILAPISAKACLAALFIVLALCFQPCLAAQTPAKAGKTQQPASAKAGQTQQPAPAQAAQTQPATAPANQPGQQQIRPEAAFALMAGEAEKGNAEAMLTLGQFYEQGVGVSKNYTKALEWYTKAAQAGQPGGHYNVGVCFEVGMGTASNMTNAIASYQKAAELGLTPAMYKLSAIYISGSGVPANPAKGLTWLEKAADAGMAQAANELGMVHLSGLLGQKKNEQKALAMFTKAANLGNLEAIKNVAVIHKDGIGVKADPAKAYTWYLIARRGGYTGENIARVLGLLEASLTTAQTQQAQKEADAWFESYAKRQQGGQ